MKRAWIIARKDFVRSFRSAFALVFMFGIPILMTGLFAFMFGSGGESPELPRAQVVVANLDQGDARLGEHLVKMYQVEELQELLAVSLVNGEEEAWAKVQRGEAAVAVIVPLTFSDALLGGEPAEVEIYQDPAQLWGAGVVRHVTSSFLESVQAPRVEIEAAGLVLAEAGADPLAVADLAAALSEPAEASEPLVVSGPVALRESVSEPEPNTEEAQNPLASIAGVMMRGMMIFFAFFTGANCAASIMEEEEKRTLMRLFSTPSNPWSILGGKFLAAWLTILVQVVLLMLFSMLVFKIQWGPLGSVALVTLGFATAASAFGLFIISLIKNSRQVGAVLGIVLTVTGMLGVFRSFAGNPGSGTGTMDWLSLLVPQGWVLQGLQKSALGTSWLEIYPLVLGLLAWSLVMMTVAVVRFQKRYI